MNSILEPAYIVTDVETTGSNPLKNRITEIACVTVRNGEIVSEYSTLINPYQEIPPYVARMTGISQSMVAAAPDEFEVIDIIKSIYKTKNSVFVAHNAAFDYGFVGSFFKRGFTVFDYPQLCTLKLARKMLPRDLKKNVGDLSGYFGIRMKNRHRALIDAKSTAMILIELLDIAEKEHKVKTLSELLTFQSKPVYNYRVSPEVTKKLQNQLEDIPYSPGIFKFFDKSGNLLYWDYSFNLNSKLNSFFGTHHITSKAILEMTPKIEFIKLEQAESELSVLIMRQKLNNISHSGSTLDLFSDTENYSRNSIKNLSTDFIYMQAQDNGEKLIDFYLVKSGKLSAQLTIGRKASLENLGRKVKEVYYQNSTSGQIDFSELKVINHWIDMQNSLGIEYIIKNNDFSETFNELKNFIPKAFEIVEPPDLTFQQYGF